MLYTYNYVCAMTKRHDIHTHRLHAAIIQTKNCNVLDSSINPNEPVMTTSCMCIHTYIQIVHIIPTDHAYRSYIQIIHTLIKIIHACRSYIQIIHTDHKYRSYIQIINTLIKIIHACRSYIQIIHTDHTYRSYIQIMHTDHTYTS